MKHFYGFKAISGGYVQCHEGVVDNEKAWSNILTTVKASVLVEEGCGAIFNTPVNLDYQVKHLTERDQHVGTCVIKIGAAKGNSPGASVDDISCVVEIYNRSGDYIYWAKHGEVTDQDATFTYKIQLDYDAPVYATGTLLRMSTVGVFKVTLGELSIEPASNIVDKPELTSILGMSAILRTTDVQNSEFLEHLSDFKNYQDQQLAKMQELSRQIADVYGRNMSVFISR